MTDPGFPQGGGVNPPRGGREHAILPNSPKNCMKLKEFGRRGGGVRPSRPPLDPPLLIVDKGKNAAPNFPAKNRLLMQAHFYRWRDGLLHHPPLHIDLL